MSNHTTNEALGNMAVLFDLIPTLFRSKLGAVEPGTPEFDLMLAALLFDIVKKRALAHRALRKYMLHADPELTRQILADMRETAHAEEAQDYSALAETTHEQMLRVLREVAGDHRELAEIVERWSMGPEEEAGMSPD